MSGPAEEGGNSQKGLPEEEIWRAALYRMFAAMLHEPPGEDLLAKVAALAGGDGEMPLPRALAALGRIARRIDPAVACREHEDLFQGVGESAFSPYESWYRTGFLYEKPLAKLRLDLARLGIQGSGKAGEPEDHLAAIFETMAALIEGRFGEPADPASQKEFFNEHMDSWVGEFFADLASHSDAHLYAALSKAGGVFLDIERKAFKQI